MVYMTTCKIWGSEDDVHYNLSILGYHTVSISIDILEEPAASIFMAEIVYFQCGGDMSLQNADNHIPDHTVW
jgi:hypothetical protein